MNFNIHYHEGKKVDFPAKVDGALAAEGKLSASVDQHYCWMWANKRLTRRAGLRWPCWRSHLTRTPSRWSRKPHNWWR